MPASGTREKGEWLQWMHFADGTAFPPLGIVVWLSVCRDDAHQHRVLIEDARQRARSALRLLEERLADRRWILGDYFTAADVMLGFTLLAGRLLEVVDPGSSLGRYLERLESREAYRTALEKTGGFG